MCRTVEVAKSGGEREHECGGRIRSASDHLTRRDQRHLEGGPPPGTQGQNVLFRESETGKGELGKGREGKGRRPCWSQRGRELIMEGDERTLGEPTKATQKGPWDLGNGTSDLPTVRRCSPTRRVSVALFIFRARAPIITIISGV